VVVEVGELTPSPTPALPLPAPLPYYAGSDKREHKPWSVLSFVVAFYWGQFYGIAQRSLRTDSGTECTPSSTEVLQYPSLHAVIVI